METRNKLWRRQKGFFKFKVRIMRLAAWGTEMIYEDGTRVLEAHWFELAKYHGFQCYRTTGTPCSCWMCRGEKYDRKAYKKETQRILKETLE